MIAGFADNDTLKELSERMETYGDGLADWVGNPTSKEFLTNYKANERAAKSKAPAYGAVYLFGASAPASADDPLEEIRLEVKYVSEFADFLEAYQNFYWKFTDKVEINASADAYIDQLIKISRSTNWVVKQGECRRNYWDTNSQRRESDTVKTWSLVHRETGSYADFSNENLDNVELVNLLHFEVADLGLRGHALNTIKEFKEVMELLLLKHPAKPLAVTSLVLGWDKDNGQKIEPWRFKSYKDQHLKNQTRLGAFWRGCGGVMGEELGLDRDPSRIYFFQKDKALQLRRVASEQGEPNPFRAAKRTIYGREADLVLRS
jgi:hypothetical protein